MGIRRWFQPKCSACRTPIPKGSDLNKTVKTASGQWIRVCRRCYSAMGKPGKLTNKRRQRPQSGGRRYGDTNPDQGRLW